MFFQFLPVAPLPSGVIKKLSHAVLEPRRQHRDTLGIGRYIVGLTPARMLGQSRHNTVSSDKAMKPVSFQGMDSASKLRRKMFFAFSVVSLLALGLLTAALYESFENRLRSDIHERLRDIVSLAALQVDVEAHKALADPKDEGSPGYARIQTGLQKIRDAATDVRFVYTMCKGAGGKILFVVDAETNPEEIAHLGETYDDAGPALSREFSTLAHPMVEDSFYTDKFGTWISGYAPFYDNDGIRRGVIGVDIAATKVLASERHFLLVAALVFALIAPLLLLAAWLLSRQLTKVAIRAQEVLLRRAEFERLISEVSSDLVKLSLDATEAGIDRALAAIGAFTKADRVYVFQFKGNRMKRMDNTHEWCAKGVEPQIEHLQDIPLARELPWLATRIRKQKIFHVPDVTALAPEAQLERAHFKAQNIQSLIIMPMVSEKRVLGFIGFDAVGACRKWTDDDQVLLQFIGKTITHVLDRKRREEERDKIITKLRNTLEHVKTLRGIVPICAKCKKIRNDKGFWDQVDVYLREHSELQLTHGICPECAKELYPRVTERIRADEKDGKRGNSI